MKNVGFIGLGIMGKPMAMNLLKAGYSLYVKDVNETAVKEVSEQGAVACTTYEEMTEKCEVIILMLPDGKIVMNVLFGPDGLSTHLSADSLVIDMSSISPVETKLFAEKLAVNNVALVDAPVSGGEPKAIDGSMAIMAGGTDRDFARALPYFEVMGGNVVHMGDVGTGSATKLVNQIMVSVHLGALSEAAIFASKSGIDLNKMYEAISNGLAGSAVMDAKIPMIVNRDFEPGGKLSTNFKDLRNIKDAANALNVPLPLTSMVEELFRGQIANGNGNKDHSYILNYYEQTANHTIRHD
ncbi:MAG: NAD-binding protein [Alkalibacterium sp.]|nr:NAD-binding protein [Alkalibacterium sp.]